jgi:Uma2 family endonuclease
MNDVSVPARARLSVGQFHRMGETGILAPDARVELIEGDLIQMAPIGQRHLHIVNRLNRALVSAVGAEAIVSVQNPVALDSYSEAYPDLTVLRRDAEREGRLPTADDVLLLVEVADTTLRYDRTTKLQLYAKHAIREVWIVNVSEAVLEVHRDPGDGAYRTNLKRTKDQSIAPVALPGVELPLAETL